MRRRVESELAANIWKVGVKPGQLVAAGDVLMILESMKLEIPVESPAKGTVVWVADEGIPVNEGDLIAEISESPAE